MRAVVIRGCNESDLMPVAEVVVAEPLERAVHRHDLDEGSHVGVAVSPIPGLVGVRNDEDVVRVVALAQPLVQGGEIGRELRADALVEGTAVEDVMVSAVPSLHGPFVAQEGDEFAGLAIADHGLADVLPLEVVHCGVVVRHAVEVEPGVVPGIPIGSIDRALPLR